jgi:hypothetical protein
MQTFLSQQQQLQQEQLLHHLLSQLPLAAALLLAAAAAAVTWLLSRSAVPVPPSLPAAAKSKDADEAAPFPAFENVPVSEWASRTGAVVPASFWGSEGHRRLIWTANVETRHPARRNGDLIANASRPINNLLVSTPEGAFYIGWSEVHDSFQYYCDHSNMRRVYLELAAITFVRRFARALPDPANPMPDPSLTDRRRFVLDQLQKGGNKKNSSSSLVEDASVQDRRSAYQQHRGAAGGGGGAAAVAAAPTTADGIAAARVRRAIDLRAAADPSRLVLDDLGGIVARGWSAEMRELWLARTLGTLSFQRAGKMEDVFHTPKLSATEVRMRQRQQQQQQMAKKKTMVATSTTASTTTTTASPLSGDSSSSSSSLTADGLRSFGMKHSAPVAKVNLTAELDMSYLEFKAARAAAAKQKEAAVEIGDDVQNKDDAQDDVAASYDDAPSDEDDVQYDSSFDGDDERARRCM